MGCSDGDTGKTNVGKVPLEERVKAIQSREDMPASAKEMAISQLRAHEAASEQGAGAALPPKK